MADSDGTSSLPLDFTMIKANQTRVDNFRTVLNVVAGGTAGVLGLTSIYGFAFYVLVFLWGAFLLTARTGFSMNVYFSSAKCLWFDGLTGGLFTYVLFWT